MTTNDPSDGNAPPPGGGGDSPPSPQPPPDGSSESTERDSDATDSDATDNGDAASDATDSDARDSDDADSDATDSDDAASDTTDSDDADSDATDSDNAASDTTDSDASDSDATDSDDADSDDDCAEIPAYPHAVLTAEIQFIVEIPYPLDQANQLPHKFTLANDDNSYSQTLTLASDGTAGDVDGACIITFAGLAEQHTYTLQCDNGSSTYSIFENVPYDQIEQLGQEGSGTTAPPPDGDNRNTDGTT
jgi:hypothetical protein